MRTLSYVRLPLTDDPYQVFTLDASVDGVPLHARFGLRYLSAPDRWVISLRNDATSELLVNQVPLICSYGELNDLFLPFRHRGAGSLFVLRNADGTPEADPAKGTLTGFRLLWGDTLKAEDPAG